MDKGTGKEQNKDTITYLAPAHPQKLLIAFDAKRLQELKEQIAKIDTELVDRHAIVDKAAKSLFADKGHLDLLKWLIAEESTRIKSELTFLYALNMINERLVTIETTLQSVGKKVNLEMPNLKAQVEKITETPAVQLLTKILSDNDEAIKKINERREKLIKDSVR